MVKTDRELETLLNWVVEQLDGYETGFNGEDEYNNDGVINVIDACREIIKEVNKEKD